MNAMETIRSKGDLAEFLVDMGCTSNNIAKIIGVNKVAIHNWRHKYYCGDVKRNRPVKPMLICDRFTFKRKVDPKTSKEYKHIQDELDTIRSAISSAMSGITIRNRKIVEMRLEGMELAEIGNAMKLSRERVRQIFTKFLQRVSGKLDLLLEQEKGETRG